MFYCHIDLWDGWRNVINLLLGIPPGWMNLYGIKRFDRSIDIEMQKQF